MKRNNVLKNLLMLSLFLILSIYAGRMPVHAIGYGTGGVAIYDSSIERNKSDETALKQLIKQQTEAGSYMPDDLEYYGWTEINGKYRLTSIEMHQAVGKISLAKFPQLRSFICQDGAVTSLNVTKCTKLETLHCDNNRLTSLNVTKNKKLTALSCSDNKISKLNVTKCPKLQSLNCSNNRLKTLNLSNNKKLSVLDIQGNKMKSINVSKCESSINVTCDSGVKIIGGPQEPEDTEGTESNDPAEAGTVSFKVENESVLSKGSYEARLTKDEVYKGIQFKAGRAGNYQLTIENLKAPDGASLSASYTLLVNDLTYEISGSDSYRYDSPLYPDEYLYLLSSDGGDDDIPQKTVIEIELDAGEVIELLMADYEYNGTSDEFSMNITFSEI